MRGKLQTATTAEKKEEVARLLEHSDEIGYHRIRVGTAEKIVPINTKLQVLFESGMARLRLK